MYGSLTYSRTGYLDCVKPVSYIAVDGGHDRAPLGHGNPWAPGTMWQFFQTYLVVCTTIVALTSKERPLQKHSDNDR